MGATRVDGLPDDIYEIYEKRNGSESQYLWTTLPGARDTVAALSPGTAAKSSRGKSSETWTR